MRVKKWLRNIYKILFAHKIHITLESLIFKEIVFFNMNVKTN